nr:transcription factor [Leptobacillium sp.]
MSNAQEKPLSPSPSPSPEAPYDPNNKALDKPAKTHRRMRSACDSCHQSKIRCSREMPCSSCRRAQSACTYSLRSRLGRPKGSKNKRTLMREAYENNQQESQALENGNGNGNICPDLSDAQQQPPPHLSPSAFDMEATSSAGTELAINHSPFGDDELNLFINTSLDSLDLLGTPGIPPPNSIQHDDGAFLVHNCHSSTSSSDCLSLQDMPLDLTGSSSSTASSESSRGPSPAGLSTPRCSCLHELAKLLSQLGDLQRSGNDNNCSLEAILTGVQIAQEPWQKLMVCSKCRDQVSQKEVSLLFSIGIRLLLSSLQQHMETMDGKSPPQRSTVSVGGFELSGDIKTEVMDMVTRKAFCTITAASLHFFERMGRQKPLESADIDTALASLGSTSTGKDKHASSRGVDSRHALHTQMLGALAKTLVPEAETASLLLKTLQMTMKLLYNEN